MTLEDVRQRCYVDEITGCWHWRGGFSVGVPRIYAVDPATDEKTATTGMRAVKMLETGKAIPKGRIVYRCKCRADDCVNPEHLRIGTKSEQGAMLRRTKELRGDPLRALINRNNAAKRGYVKITPALAEEIRRSDEIGVALAKRLGISESTVSRYRNGVRAPLTLATASVFSMARVASNMTREAA
jgi:hypothetical protein